MITKLQDLTQIGLNPTFINYLRADYSETLLNTQAEALRSISLLHQRRSAIISAPTASGKTLLGELAALGAVQRKRMALYLVPTRSLAEEKVVEFQKRYASSSLCICCTTRESRTDDSKIIAGEADLVVAVYEKAFGLLAVCPGLWGRLGSIVADEVHLIGDQERGPAIDLFLTEWKRMQQRPQLIALSAVFHNSEEFAAWLEIDHYHTTQRPVPLREGVLDISLGNYRWRDISTGEQGTERLASINQEDDHIHVSAILELASTVGPTIVFCTTLNKANHLAQELAQHSKINLEDETLLELKRLDSNLSRESLEVVLEKGIGLHTADMPRSHRQIVESLFSQGKLSVLVATPTLEQGVNLDAACVISSPAMVGKCGPSQSTGLVPTSRMRLLNQGGRAGRRGDKLGRSILLAKDSFEADQLFDTFIGTPLEKVESRLGECDLEKAILQIIASHSQCSRQVIHSHLESTFCSYQKRVTAYPINSIIEHLVSQESLQEKSAELLAVTPLGLLAARSRVSSVTISFWLEYLEDTSTCPPRDALLLLICLADEWSMLPVRINNSERRRNTWPTGMIDRLDKPHPLSTRLLSLFETPNGSPFTCHRAARIALMLSDWVGGLPLNELELRHQLPSGRIARAASEAAWLLITLAELAGLMRRSEEVIDGIELLAHDLEELEGTLSQPRERPTAVPSVSSSPEPFLESEPISSSKKMLTIFKEQQGIVEWQGSIIELSPIPYRLLLLLVEQEGAVVPYDTIHASVWPDAQVQNQMISHHARIINQLLPWEEGKVVRVHKRYGLYLAIDSELVEFSNKKVRPPLLKDSAPQRQFA